jgi:hypothetical protein
MKILSKFLLILIVAGCGAAFSAQPASDEQTQGSIRVAVVGVSRTKVVPSQTGSSSQPVAGVKLVYVVEALGNAPIQNFTLGRIGLSVNGKPMSLSKKSDDESLIIASDYAKYDWKNLNRPAVSDPRRAVVYDYSIPYFELPKGETELRIAETGFNSSTVTFVFSGVAVE